MHFKSLKSLENLLHLEVLETFQTYRFQKSGLKEYLFRKKKATENEIGLKEYTLNFGVSKFVFL